MCMDAWTFIPLMIIMLLAGLQALPKEVLEAAMIWLARDIWPNVDDVQNLPFTWNAASKLMANCCSKWSPNKPTFEKTENLPPIKFLCSIISDLSLLANLCK